MHGRAGAMVAMGAMLLGGSTAALAQGGTVQGMVTTRAPAPRAIRVTFDQRVCGSELPDESILVDAAGRLANVVVTLVGVKAKAPSREAIVVNDKCAFVPRVQVVASGGTVKTSSKDPMLHTTVLQQADGRQLFNVALPAPGIEISKPLAGPGVMRVGCSTHQWMRGWIIVSDDMSAVTGADGRFTLGDVPPGTHELRVWHESLKAEAQTITVVDGKTVDVRVDMR
ncbi:MAG: carboxypeptidase regulatory-like domain-containing protein [Acidobacteriota bacterium]|nr:carboxypeptidase regulatory-like domain-containing protein [Acidobacteriota bacterium]